MNAVSVTIACVDDQLQLRAERMLGNDLHVATARTPLPAAELLGDLLRPVQAGHGSATRLGRLMGDLLFSGDVGTLMRGAMAMTEPVVLLETDAERSEWPWELAIDPETGARPALEGAMARVGGRPWTGGPITPRGVLAVPTLAGGPRREALLASTRRLARKTPLDVFPADPATGPGLRRVMTHGAALMHIEGVGPQGRVLLDDGPVPVDRLGVDANAWLVVLGGTETNADSGRRLREAGAAMVLAHQLELRTHQTAAIDRELYRALAEGATLLEAVGRVRLTLAGTEGEKSGAWAAPVLWTAPGEITEMPVARVFPPEVRAPTQVGFDGPAPSDAPLPYPDLAGPPGHPVPAAVFVQDTLRRMQAGADDTQQRAAAMQALAGSVAADPADAADPATLVDKLVDAIGRPDAPLARPDSWSDRVGRLVEQSALAASVVRRAAHAVLAAPVVCLCGPPGSGAERLARLLTETVFDRHPTITAGATGGPLEGGPRRGEAGALTAGGWLYRTVALNWRRDEVDPLRPDQPPPTTRMPLVVPRPGRRGYAIRRGSWLVVHAGQSIDPTRLTALAAAVETGVLSGITDDALYRLPVPADFRLIIVANHPLDHLPPTVPHVAIDAPADEAVLKARWLAEAGQALGAPRDEAGALARGALVDRVWGILRIAGLVTRLPADVASSVVRHAAARGSTPEALDEALEMVLARHLVVLSADRFAILGAGLTGDRSGLFKAVVQAARHGDVLPALTLAEALGHPEAVDYAAEPDKLAARINEWQRQAVIGLPNPEDVAGLRRALVLRRAL